VPAYSAKCPLLEEITCEAKLAGGEENYAVTLTQGTSNIVNTFNEKEEGNCTNGEKGILGLGGEFPSSAEGLTSSLS
jgi:hypothetical protein